MGDVASSAKRKFIILSACKENLEKSYTNNLTASLKATPPPKKENSPRQRRHQEIIKLRPEIKKKKEGKRTIQRVT